MEIIGIIAEYNPFHNGHIYHLKKIKDNYPNSIIIAVISTSFTQRGHISILDKFEKTKICLDNLVDLVIQLPTFYSTQSADYFSKGAIEILNHLKVSKIIIGSESNDIRKLYDLANIQINNPKFDEEVKLELNNNNNYPTALSNALYNLLGYTITTPNDLLGISYYKIIIEKKFNIVLETIQRTNDFHDNISNSNIISASNIRIKYINNENIDSYLPTNIINKLNKDSNSNYFKLLKYKIISNLDELNTFLSVDEGIENRIKKHIIKSNNLDELITNIKNKRYTYNKLTRMFTHILLDIKKTDFKELNSIEYIEVLGFSKLGQQYLKTVVNNDIIITSNTNKIISKTSKLERRVIYIYDLIFNLDNNLNDKNLLGKPLIKED